MSKNDKNEVIEELKDEKEKKKVNEALRNKFTTTKKILWLSWIMLIGLIVLNVLGYEVSSSIEVIGGIATSVTTSLYL